MEMAIQVVDYYFETGLIGLWRFLNKNCYEQKFMVSAESGAEMADHVTFKLDGKRLHFMHPYTTGCQIIEFSHKEKIAWCKTTVSHSHMTTIN